MKYKSIVIDCQVLQTSAWTRGMGRYLASFIMGIYENDDYPEVHLIFNKNLKTSPDCKDIIHKVAPDAKVVELEFPKGLSNEVEAENVQIFDEYIERKGLQGAFFVSSSLFSFDYQPAFPTHTINSCIFYDMIPLKQWETFHRYFPAQEYFKRFKHLFTCEYVLAISEASRGDLLQYLGLKPDKVLNIAGAEIPHFMASESEGSNKTPKDFRYILLPGGNSPHKNMLRAIRGFDIFNGEFGDAFKLVITSFYSDENIAKMNSLSSNIVLTGSVSDDELHDLYRNAEAILFPSLDEGLGLPVLEAVGYEKPVVCSNIEAFKEISSQAFYFFDPYVAAEIAEAIHAAITKDQWEKKLESYPEIKKKFTWAHSAAVILDLKAISKSKKSSEGGSIIIEQAGDMDTLEKVARCLSTFESIENVTLYIDGRFERNKLPYQVPIIFASFMPNADIVDAPKKAKGRSIVVLTEKSQLSVPVGLALESEFMGKPSEVKVAIRNFALSMGSKIDGPAKNKLKKSVTDRLV